MVAKVSRRDGGHGAIREKPGLPAQKLQLGAQPAGGVRHLEQLLLAGELHLEHAAHGVARGEGVIGQDFEPRPSPEVCSWCDYRLICPAAEG